MKDKFLKIKIDSSVYKKNTVLKVISTISDEYMAELEKNGRYYLVKIIPRYKPCIDSQKLRSLFFDHLNNQIIKDKVYKETHLIRDLIVSKALFETEAFDNTTKSFDINNYKDTDNYMLDPENIAKPTKENHYV